MYLTNGYKRSSLKSIYVNYQCIQVNVEKSRLKKSIIIQKIFE